MEQDVTDAENRLRAMKSQRDEIESDAKELLNAIQSITEQLEEGQEEYGGLKGEVAELAKAVNKLKAAKIEVDQKVETADDAINAKKGEIHHSRAKVCVFNNNNLFYFAV